MSLISAEEFAAALDDPDLRIADVRWLLAVPGGGRDAYATAHLPGAVFVDLESVLTAATGPGRHPLPDPAAFAAALGALGIGRRHRVVAYDDAGGTVAARLWWMLDALGHAQAAVLDGGIGAWRAAGLPVAAEVPVHAALPPEEQVSTPGVGSAWPRTIDRVALAARLGEVLLLDARAVERYRGEIEPIDRVPGHIPTARSLPTSALLDAGGRFLAPAALASRFAVAGVGGGGAVPAVGAGGGGAAGLPDPLLYPGSYSDWTQSGMPFATGDAPGDPPGDPPVSHE
ncbi:MAG TPA: rhodanese-like domain-containing protein [Candidatus Limnocylindrales bacterium]